MFEKRTNQIKSELENEFKGIEEFIPRIPTTVAGNYYLFIPEAMPYLDPIKFESAFLSGFKLKRLWNEEGMYAFVSWKWVKPLAKYLKGKRCLEVMAGRGWLSLALRHLNIDIVATDDMSWAYNGKHKKMQYLVTDVTQMDAVESVERYGECIDVIIISWPYMDDTAYRAIKKLNEINPNALIIYIGEGDGGCTADDNFHEHFEIVNDEVFEKASEEYERWDGIHDQLLLGRYI
jgi:hypothetical protein